MSAYERIELLFEDGVEIKDYELSIRVKEKQKSSRKAAGKQQKK